MTSEPEIRLRVRFLKRAFAVVCLFGLPSIVTAAAKNDYDCKNDDPGAVVVKDVA